MIITTKLCGQDKYRLTQSDPCMSTRVRLSDSAHCAVSHADLIYEVPAPITIILALCALRLALEK